MNGGQGHGAGREPEGMDPVPPLEQGLTPHFAERCRAEEQAGVDGTKQIAPAVELAAAASSQGLLGA